MNSDNDLDRGRITPEPITGVFRPRDDPLGERIEEGDHIRGWNIATQRALRKVYPPADKTTPRQVTVVLGAQISPNPGSVIEYIATII